MIQQILKEIGIGNKTNIVFDCKIKIKEFINLWLGIICRLLM